MIEMVVDTYFKKYTDLVDASSAIEALEEGFKEHIKLLESIPITKELFAYSEGKWTTKQLFAHVIDCERVFTFRALSFARIPGCELPGFDHDAYAFQDVHNQKDMAQLMNEYSSTRQASIDLFKGFSKSDLDHTGFGNGKLFSVEAIAYIMAGHEKHHFDILAERYLT